MQMTLLGTLPVIGGVAAFSKYLITSKSEHLHYQVY